MRDGCWHIDSNERTTFTDLCEFLAAVLVEEVWEAHAPTLPCSTPDHDPIAAVDDNVLDTKVPPLTQKRRSMTIGQKTLRDQVAHRHRIQNTGEDLARPTFIQLT